MQHADDVPGHSHILYDGDRQRTVPVMIYWDSLTVASPAHLAIISHGYGGTYRDYTFIAAALVKEGYLVASIQHDLAGDPPLARQGEPNLYERRMPHWQRGVANIQFVLNALRQSHPSLQAVMPVLIGHSNGGDMSVLFARRYPHVVSAVITLDNRRVPLPRASRPRFLSLRASDQFPDEGVIPKLSEQEQFGMRVIALPVAHNDMSDRATPHERRQMLAHILDFLAHR